MEYELYLMVNGVLKKTGKTDKDFEKAMVENLELQKLQTENRTLWDELNSARTELDRVNTQAMVAVEALLKMKGEI